MLRKLGVKFPQIVANPPFKAELDRRRWPLGEQHRRHMAYEPGLLATLGAFICGRDRFRREVLSREDAAGVFATVECEDLFDDTALPCLIAFFVGLEDRYDDGRPARRG